MQDLASETNFWERSPRSLHCVMRSALESDNKKLTAEKAEKHGAACGRNQKRTA
jgi:hypothetical protein